MHAVELPIAPRWTGDYTHNPAVSSSHPPGVPMPLVDKRVASLREENARLRKEVEELRTLLQATQVVELGHSLVRYVLDVLCAMLAPQRGQALIVAGADLLDRDNPISAGPLQMALERPSLLRALEGQPSQVATPYGGDALAPDNPGRSGGRGALPASPSRRAVHKAGSGGWRGALLAADKRAPERQARVRAVR